jgi:hypothetical protein
MRGWNRLSMLFRADELLGSTIRESVIQLAVINYL